MSAKFAVRSNFTRHASHLGREGPQLVHHRVDRFFELQNLAAHVHGDLLGQVAIGDRDRDLRDVSDLSSEVARHLVDRLR